MQFEKEPGDLRPKGPLFHYIDANTLNVYFEQNLEEIKASTPPNDPANLLEKSLQAIEQLKANVRLLAQEHNKDEAIFIVVLAPGQEALKLHRKRLASNQKLPKALQEVHSFFTQAP